MATIASAQTSGNSLNFDGVDDHVTSVVPSLISNLGSNDFTAEVWVKPQGAAFARVFFAQADLDNFANVSVTGLLEPIFYIVVGGVNYSIQSTQTLVVDEWAHLAVTWNAGATEPKMYINGVLATLTAGSFISSTALDNTLTLGSRTDGAQLFLGEIDEFTIWDIEKTACEIAAEQNAKYQGDELNLIRYYNFDSGLAGGNNTGVISLQDQTANADNGTLVNFGLSAAASNWVASGASIDRWFGNLSAITMNGLALDSDPVFQGTIQWINCAGNTPISGATNATFNPNTDDPNFNGTTASYAIISSNGTCADTSDCFLYDVTGVGELTKNQLGVYPNPSNGMFSINVPENAEKINVYAMNGELVASWIPTTTGEIQVNLSNLSGVFMIHVQTQTTVLSEKLVLRNNE